MRETRRPIESSAESKGYSRALYPGRFQPFHSGHLEAVKYVLSNASEVIVMIGSALQSHTLKNPFTSGERMMMVRLALTEAGISPDRYYIVPVPDLEIHGIWVSHVCSLVPRFDVVYSNEPLTRRLFIEAGFKVKRIPFYRRAECSATEIRERMLKGISWEALLPKSVARYIKEIRGVERLRDLAETDKIRDDAQEGPS
ncbi:MAG: nicotinamide-nucleotide adenylyltransferase [Candidatus Bathyarchaeota archaeon B63]|nr:MAG: nicotinamide-nucleotide adenylyltransferase [Candidatus Bathyarchaeota archaeon B63]